MRDTSVTERALTRGQALRELGATAIGSGALGGGRDALLAQATSAAHQERDKRRRPSG